MQKEKAEKFADALQAWLDSYAKDNDFTSIRVKSISLGTGKFTASLTAEKADELPTNAHYAGMLGLPADIIGQTVKEGSKIMRIVRLEPNRPKNCIIIIEEGTGKTYKAPASWYHQQARLGRIIQPTA